MNIKPVIKWSGSKRSQAFEIVNKIPKHNKYFEPFRRRIYNVCSES